MGVSEQNEGEQDMSGYIYKDEGRPDRRCY